MMFQKKVVPLPHNFEAIHNKDYSVVKTFKAGFAARLFYGVSVMWFS